MCFVVFLLGLSARASESALYCRVIAVKVANGGLIPGVSYENSELRPEISQNETASNDEVEVFDASLGSYNAHIFIKKDLEGNCVYASSIQIGLRKIQVPKISCTEVIKGDETYGLGVLKENHRYVRLYGVRLSSAPLVANNEKDSCLDLLNEDINEDEIYKSYQEQIEKTFKQLMLLN